MKEGEFPANYRLYRNGAIYDTDKGRIVAVRPELAEKNTQITRENTGEMLAKRLERKRNIIAAAAASAVERDDYRQQYGGDAWIAAIAEAQYIKATTPDDPKSTDAARFLLTEAGLSDKQQAQAPAETASDILASLASLAASLVRAADVDIVDGRVTGDGEAEEGTDDGG